MAEQDKFDSRFSEIIRDYQEEMRDPVVSDLFDAVDLAESALEAAGESADDHMSDVHDALNDALFDSGIYGRPVIVTGKVRPTDFILEGGSAEEKKMFEDKFGDLGELLYDHRGRYYNVSRLILICGEFDSTNVYSDPSKTDIPKKKIVVYLNAALAENPATGWFYAYPEDLSIFNPVEPSALKIEQDINESYTGIALQLDALPDDCGDDEAILYALKKLRLELNWHSYPKHLEDERQELVKHIETYITRRVKLDSTLYTLDLNGPILGTNECGQQYVKRFDTTTSVNGLLKSVLLIREVDEPTGDTEPDENVAYYRLMLEFSASISGRNSAEQIFHVPVSTVEGIRNLRNTMLSNQQGREV